MIRILRRLFRCETATAAVEAAIFAPFFLILTIGVTDLGSGMFLHMTLNAATQAGAAYAVINPGSTCNTESSACKSNIWAAMNDASGGLLSCSDSTCPVSFATCADPDGGICWTISVDYTPTYWPMLPANLYSWATSGQTLSSQTTVRVPTT
jgi:Flp pilus assembly protein TadG